MLHIDFKYLLCAYFALIYDEGEEVADAKLDLCST